MKTSLTAMITMLSGLVLQTAAPAQSLSLDPNFRPSFTSILPPFSGFSGSVFALPDGKFMVGGGFPAINGTPTPGGLARLNADGSVDTTFDTSQLQSQAVGDYPELKAVQADGKPLLVSYTPDARGDVQVRLLRLNIDGSTDVSFRENFLLANGWVGVVLALSDGRSVVQQEDSPDSFKITRIDSSGKEEPAFKPVSLRPFGGEFSMAAQSDGRLVIGGSFTNVNNQPVTHLARINTDGSLDYSFKPGLLPGQLGISVFQVAVENDGRILVAGYGRAAGDFNPSLVRLNPDGSLDPFFNPKPEGVRPFLPLSNGKLLVTDSCGLPVRLSAEGSADPSFSVVQPTNAISCSSYADQLQSGFAESPGGKILLAYYGFQPFPSQPGLALLNPDGSLDMTFRANLGEVFPTSQEDSGASVSGIAFQPDGKLLVAGTFDFVANTQGKDFVRLNQDGTLDSAFKPDFSVLPTNYRYSRLPLALGTDGKIVLAARSPFIPNITVIARLMPDGQLDKILKTYGGTFPVNALAVQTDGKVLVGGEGVGQDSSDLGRVDANGQFDLAFKAQVQLRTDLGGEMSIAPQPDGRIVLAGAFADINGSPGLNLARLHPDGSLDAAFNPWKNRDGLPLFVTRQSDGRFRVLGWRGENSYEFVIVSEDGQVESSEPVGGFVDSSLIYAMTAQADGGVLIGGQFTRVLGQPRLCLARLIPRPSLSTPTLLNNGQIQFQLSGLLNSTVAIEATTSLFPAEWRAVRTNILTVIPFSFADAETANTPQRFYRAVAR